MIELEAGRASRPLIERGYAPATSTATIDLAAATFEAELDALLDLAAAELNLRRLSAEVARTTRQVSALEQVVIPRLAGEQRAITATLELAWDLLDAAVHLGEHARIGPAGMAKQGLRHGVLLLTRRALRMIGPGLRLPRPLLAHVQLEERPVRETKPAQRAGSGKGGGHVVLLRLAAEMRSPQLTGGYMSNGSRPGWTGHAIPVVARWR